MVPVWLAAASRRPSSTRAALPVAGWRLPLPQKFARNMANKIKTKGQIMQEIDLPRARAKYVRSNAASPGGRRIAVFR
jgi:hypothetical protein